jgi:hypothetical protein
MKDELLSKIKIELEKSIEINERLVKYTKEYLDIPTNDLEEEFLRFRIDETKMHAQLHEQYKRFSLERRLPNINLEECQNIIEEYLIRNGLAKMFESETKSPNKTYIERRFIPTEKGKKYMGIVKKHYYKYPYLESSFYTLEFEEFISTVFPNILPRY